jgi:Tfp pilus assembly protein PilV
MTLMNRRNIKGFTLLEAFLAAFIFIISVSAIFVTMTALRKPAVNNEQAVQAAILLRDTLEELRAKVDSVDEAGNIGDLSLGSHSINTKTLNGVPVVINYLVSADGSGGKIVDATMTYSDAL